MLGREWKKLIYSLYVSAKCSRAAAVEGWMNWFHIMVLLTNGHALLQDRKAKKKKIKIFCTLWRAEQVKKKLLMIYCIPFKPSFHNWFISSPSAVLRLLIKNLTHPAVHLPDNLANDEGADNIKSQIRQMRVKRVRILDVKDENDSIIDIDMWAKFLNLKKLKILTFYHHQRRLLIEAVIIVYHCYVSCIHKALNEINLSTFTS